MDISLIILNYNLSQFVSRAIRSCLNQVIFRKNIEIIVVDDNSSDDSLKIINEFKNDITIIKNKINRGIGFSSNQALKKSKGKFWMRVDADDFLNQHACQTMLYLLEENENFDYVYCDHFRVDVDGVKIKKVKLNNKPNLFRHGAGILFRRDILIEIGGYDEKMRNCEDYDLLARLHILKKKGFYIPVPLYRYYIHGKNITLKKERKKMELKMKEKYGL